MERVAGDKPSVQVAAFLLQYPHGDLYSGVAQLLNAAPLHFGKGVDASADHALHALADDEVGAGRSLAVVRARLKRDIDGGFVKQRLKTDLK